MRLVNTQRIEILVSENSQKQSQNIHLSNLSLFLIFILCRPDSSIYASFMCIALLGSMTPYTRFL